MRTINKTVSWTIEYLTSFGDWQTVCRCLEKKDFKEAKRYWKKKFVKDNIKKTRCVKTVTKETIV